MERFAGQLQGVGGKFAQVPRKEVGATIVQIAQGITAKSFIAWKTPLLVELGVGAALKGAGLQSVDYPTEPTRARTVLDSASLGIIEAELALSESGTIGFTSDALRGRLVACLPRVLVAVLDPARLIGRIDDVAAWLRGRGALPPSLTLMTGPSRTGDIGDHLVIGAHGPGVLHVVAIAD